MEDHFPTLVWAHWCQAPSRWISHLTLPREAPTLFRRCRQVPANVVALCQKFTSLVCVTNSLLKERQKTFSNNQINPKILVSARRPSESTILIFFLDLLLRC